VRAGLENRSRIAAPPILLVVLLACSSTIWAQTPSIDHGFQLLYNLQFAEAQREFEQFVQVHPDDPLGPVSQAAGLLFAEFDRLGVLESHFFVHDSAFRSLKKQPVDPGIHAQFDAALRRAEDLAQRRLSATPNDRDALFTVTLVAGLRADYAALIEDRKLGSLHFTKEATHSAEHLLALYPDCYDAYVATGISRYLIGSLAAPVRWILRMGGFSGDKQQGIGELRLAAEHGRYLAAFARILLAIAYLREKDSADARQLLAQLHRDYPRNTLFTREIARLETEHAANR
jgi:tetratricopeptide (TPR) repeat protein